MQDENLTGWHKDSINGKIVQASCLGRIKSKIKSLDCHHMIDKYISSTKECYRCGTRTDIGLSRTYKCPTCGYVEDRDIKAAKTILMYGLSDLGAERAIDLIDSNNLAIISECYLMCQDKNWIGLLSSANQEATTSS